MRRIFYQGIVITLLCQFPAGFGYAESLPIQSLNVASTSNTEIVENLEGVRVHFKNQRLHEVLREIQDKTGIQFQMKDEMREVLITADIRASDWESALDRLLREFSLVKLWDSQSNLSRIHLLGVGEFPSSSHAKAEVTKVPKRKKPAWKCFSLSGKRKC